MDWSALTIPEAVGIVGLAGTLLTVYKATVDSKKLLAPVASSPAVPSVAGVTVDIDKRYVEAMEALSVAFTSVAVANTRLGEVNARQATAMEGIAKALGDWIHKYERDKDEDRLDSLETQVMKIYNIIAPAETKPVRRRQLPEND